MDNNIVKITRFTSTYPLENPDSYIIGFSVHNDINKRSFYKEIRIFYREVSKIIDDEEVSNVAWNKLKSYYENWINDNKKKNKMVGKTFFAS